MSWRWAPLAARCWRERRISEMAGARNPRRPSTIRTCFCRPILIALRFCPHFARAYESRKMSHRGETGSSSTARTWVAPRGARALIRMAVVGRRSFFLNYKAIDAPALIVGERPLRLCSWSGMFPPLVRQGPSPCAVTFPARLQEGAGDELGLAPESGRKRTRRTPWRGWSHGCLRLLAAVRGAFGAGVSRG
jgi:hypothetical protein